MDKLEAGVSGAGAGTGALSAGSAPIKTNSVSNSVRHHPDRVLELPRKRFIERDFENGENSRSAANRY
jgi:hypothetical protein